MATLHFEQHPMNQDFNAIEEKDIEGVKTKDWKKRADYDVTITIVLQIDTTNVSDRERSVAPNITFLSVNQAIVNIYRTFNATGVGFEDFKTEYLAYEQGIELYVRRLMNQLNSARAEAGLMGQWYINYALNDRTIEMTAHG